MSNRLVICFSLCCVLFSLLFYRIGDLATSPNLSEASASRTTYTLQFSPTRASIYDTNMNLLVNNTTEFIVACLPTPENILALTQSTDINSMTSTTIEELVQKGQPFLTTAATNELDLPYVNTFTRLIRNDSNALAKHIVGYTNDSSTGMSGIELAFDDYLNENSSVSSISYIVNGIRQPILGIEPTIDLAQTPTNGVVLTIDYRLQELVENIGSQMIDKGAIVVMDPITGSIKASASFPDYDPDNLTQALTDSENAPLINRAFYSYNVGSTFKIVTTIAALKEEVEILDDFYCNGYINIRGQIFRCHNLTGHGELDLQQALAVSCNPYFIELGQRIDKQNFLNTASDLSFGKATQFAQEYSTQSGYLPTLTDLTNPADVGNFSFGQGLLMATPVQLAQMMSTILNDGNTPNATLVEGITYNGKIVDERSDSLPMIKAFDTSICDMMKEYLVACVMETENQKATPEYTTAGGKTATAQTGQYVDGTEILHGWFVGFFPADEPKYVVSVVVENASSGNADASPVFKAIADELYKPLYYVDFNAIVEEIIEIEEIIG